MTKSTITREQLHERARENVKALKMASRQTAFESAREEILADLQLAELALAAMDSEPVVWGNGCDKTVPAALRFLAENERPFGGESRFNAAHLYQLAREIELMAEAPLYRHAQPAPVELANIALPHSWLDGEGVEVMSANEVKRACRAAMLQAGNSPAQSDCCPAQNHVSPEQNGDTPAQSQGWIPVSEQKPDCWCRTCRPVTLNDMRFVVCPDCGNKRCPRANDHRNSCTGSNEPGQEGSAYPDTPREVKGE